MGLLQPLRRAGREDGGGPILTEPLLGHGIVAFVALQRVCEIAYATANASGLRARGGIVPPKNGMLGFIVFHSLWLVAVGAERLLLGARMFDTGAVIAIVAALVVVEAMRVWVLVTLGRRWTIELVVVPGEAPVARGPYRFLRHPNYAVVIGEVLLIPLLAGAWRTAIFGSLLHIPVLAYRIRREEEAWRRIAGAGLNESPRFLPALKSPGV